MKAKRPTTPKRTARATAKPSAKEAPRPRAATKRTVARAESAPPARASTPAPPPKKKRTAPPRALGAEPREPGAPSGPVIEQIRELEAQLDRLLDHASQHPPGAQTVDVYEADLEMTQARFAADGVVVPPSERSAEADPNPEGLDERRVLVGGDLFPPPPPPEPVRAPARPAAPAIEDDDSVFDTTRELLSSDFYLRKWGRLAMRGRSEQVDDFGFDPIYDEKARGVLEFLYRRYFRVATTGLERIPAEGRCLLVANHSGTIPLDGLMLKAAVKLEHPSPRDVRWLTEDFIHHMPYLGSTMNRLGAVRACQENAERLLRKEALCAVFPEGLKGIGKLFSERYRLQRFGRGGFIKLCLRTNTPIIPVAIVGAEETNPLLFKIEYLSRALGLPYVPVTPTFPALGPLGLLPAPTKWQIHFGEMLDFTNYGREAADDDVLVGRLAERVRARIQGMLDRAVATRKSVFFG